MTTKEIYRLIQTDFDCLENHVHMSRHSKCVGTFDSPGAVDEFLKMMAPAKIYLGWDHELYPQFKIEREIIWTKNDGESKPKLFDERCGDCGSTIGCN